MFSLRGLAIWLFLCTAVSSCILVACSTDDKASTFPEELLGTWRFETSPEVIGSFYRDGTITMTYPESLFPRSFVYKASSVDDGSITADILTAEPPFEQARFEFSLPDESTLILSSSDETALSDRIVGRPISRDVSAPPSSPASEALLGTWDYSNPWGAVHHVEFFDNGLIVSSFQQATGNPDDFIPLEYRLLRYRLTDETKIEFYTYDEHDLLGEVDLIMPSKDALIMILPINHGLPLQDQYVRLEEPRDIKAVSSNDDIAGQWGFSLEYSEEYVEFWEFEFFKDGTVIENATIPEIDQPLTQVWDYSIQGEGDIRRLHAPGSRLADVGTESPEAFIAGDNLILVWPSDGYGLVLQRQ